VADCVSGILAAWRQPEQSIGEVFNIGGGQVVSLNRVIAILGQQLGVEPRVLHAPARPGDQRETAANIEKARRRLGYTPRTTIEEGLHAQAAWQHELLAQPAR
jgi:nucleoside-diphosphate-sugar epimerase